MPSVTLSLSNSTLTSPVSQLVSGNSAILTLALRDNDKNAYFSVDSFVAFSNSGGTSTGTLGPVVLNADGTYSASFTASQAGTPTMFSATVNGAPITSSLPGIQVLPGSASHFVVVSGTAQSAVVGTTLSNPFVVLVKDASGNPLPGATIDWTVSGGGGSLSVAKSATGSAGRASASLTLGTAVGINSVTATVEGTSDSVLFTANGTVGPISASASTVNSSPATVNADGSTSSTVSVTLTDAYGNPISGKTVTLTSSRGSSDSISSASGPSNSLGIVTFTVTSHAIGSATFSAIDTGDSVSLADTAMVTFLGGAPVIAIQAGDHQTATVANALGSNPEILLRDSYGNPIVGTQINWTVTQGGGSVADALTTTDASGLASTAWTLGTVAGSNQLSATVNGTAYAVNFTATALAGAAASIAANGGDAQSATAGSTLVTPFTAIVKDAYGNVVSNATVTWNVTQGGGSLSSNSGTTNSSGLATSTLTLGSVAGTNVATASIAGVVTPGSFNATGTPGTVTAAQSSVLASLSSVTANGTATSAITAILRDANSNPVSGKTVTLVSNRGVTDAISPVSGTTNAIGQVIFTVSSTTAGSSTFSANDATDGVAITQTAGVAFTAGAPATIAVSGGNAQTATAGTELASPFSVIVKDANGNAVNGAAITWAVTSGGGALSTTSSTTNSSGLATSVLTLGTVAGTNTATASVSGVASPATFTATGSAGVAATIAVSSGNNQSGIAGSALGAPYTAIVKDSNGNAVSGLTVTWSVSVGGGSLSSASSSTNSSGLASSTLTLGTLAGTNTVTASVSGLATPATFTSTGGAGPPASIAVSSGNNQSSSAGATLGTPLVALVKDTNGNAIWNATVNWAVTGGGGSLASASSLTNSNGLASDTLTLGTSNGTNTVSATVNGTAFVVTFSEVGSAGGVNSSTSTLNVSLASITANGTSTSTITVTLKDANSNPVTGKTVTLSSSRGSSDSISAASGASNGSGVVTFTVSSTTAGSSTYTATDTSDTVTLSNTAGVAFTAGSPASIAISSGNTQSATAGTALGSAFTAVVKDANGNPVSGSTVTWAVTSGGGSLSSASNSTNSGGLSSSTLTVGTTAGSNTVTASVAGVASPATFAATGVSGAAASIAVSSGNAQSGTAGSAPSSPLVAIVKDTNGNVVSGVTVDWTVTSGGGSLTSSSVSTDSGGLSSDTLTLGTAAGSNTVTATVHGTAFTASFTETGSAGAATTIAVSSGNSQTGTAGAALSSAFTAIVKDANGNLVSGATVTWAVTGGGGSLSSSSNATNSGGLSSSTLSLGTTAGTNTVTASVSGVATPATFTATGSAGAASAITVSSGNSQSGVAGSLLSSSFVAIVKDTNGNPVSGVSVSWSVTGGGGSLSSSSSSSNLSGFSSSTLTLGTTAGTNTVTAAVTGIATPATFTASGVAGAVSPTLSTVVSSTSSVTANGSASSTITITLKDGNSNPLSGKTVALSSSRGSSDTISAASGSSSSLGVVTFTVTSPTAGTSTYTATDFTDSVAITQTASVSFVAGAAATIAVSSGNSQTGTAGAALSASLVAVVKDANGNVIPSATVTWTLTGGGGALSACATTTDSSGLVQCTMTTGTTAGTNTATARVTGVATPATFTETGAPGSIASVAFTQGISSTSADATQTIAVTEYDSNSNVLTSDNSSAVTLAAYSTVNCTGTALAGALSTTSGTVSAGLDTLNSFGIIKTSAHSVLATIGGQSACAGSLSITAGSAYAIAATSGSGQSANDGSAVTNPLVATVTDDHGNAVGAGTSVSWAVTSGNGALSSCTTSSNSSGQVQCTFTLGTGKPSTTNTVTATASGIATPATFTETGVSIPFSSTWNFTSASPFTASSSTIDFNNGYAELTPSSQTDNSNVSLGFAGGTATGTAWSAATDGNGSSDYVMLSQTGTATDLALDSSWTPAWSNLVGYWKLDDSSSPIVNSSGTSIPGTVHGGVTLGVSGKLGTGATFDGSTGYVDFVGTGSAFSFGNATFTTAFWVKTTSTTSGMIVDQNEVSGGWSAALYSSGAILVAEKASGGQNQVYSAQSVNDGNWHHVVVVITTNTTTAASNVLTIYIDGKFSSTSGPCAYAYVVSSGPDLALGARNVPTSPTTFFAGTIDDVAFWNTGLSASAISTLYQHQAAKYAGTYQSRVMDGLASGQSWATMGWTSTLPFGKELIDNSTTTPASESSTTYSSLSSSLMTGISGLWHLDEAVGTTGSSSVIDRSGNNYNGTPSGTIAFGEGGKLGTAALFDGSTGYIGVGNSLYDTQSQGTISAWINIPKQMSSGGTVVIFFGASATSTSNLFGMGVTGYSSTSMRLWAQDRVSGVTVAGSTSFIPGQWYHVALSSNGTAWKLYVNGAPETMTFTGGSNPGTWFNHVVSGTMRYSIGATQRSSGTVNYFPGTIDEVAIWNRALTDGTGGATTNEILELYRRGANRIRYQVRSCPDSTCSTNPTWLGSDGTSQTYFTELNNNSVPSAGGDLSSSDSVNPTAPSLTFSNFGSLTVPTNRYFQYRAIMESDDTGTACNYGSGYTATWCSPELQSVAVGPTHYDTSAPTIINNSGVNFATLSSFVETLGTGSCTSTAYNLSTDGVTWYYVSGSTWTIAGGTASTASSASMIASNLSTFATQVGAGKVYFKVFLQSSGTSSCAINSLVIGGTQ